MNKKNKNVWGERFKESTSKIFEKIEQVSYRGARYYLGVHRFASTNALLGDLGWTSARTRHKLLILKLWNRLCEMPLNRLTKKVFSWDLLYSTRRGTWSYNAKNILFDVDCHDSFYNTNSCNIDQAKEALCVIDETDWDIHVRRYKSEKLRYYNMYKSSKDSEEYVKLNIKEYHRSLFAQFRCGFFRFKLKYS